MKYLFTFILLSLSNLLLAQAAINMDHPIFNAPSQNGGRGNIQNNYFEDHLTNDDRQNIKYWIDKVTKDSNLHNVTRYDAWYYPGEGTWERLSGEVESYLDSLGLHYFGKDIKYSSGNIISFGKLH